MPVGPDQITQFRPLILQEIETKIDEMLRFPNILDRKVGNFPDYYLHLTVCASLYPEEKTYLEDAYQKAGWFITEVHNSGDNGERPGLVGVLLFATEKAFTQYTILKARDTQSEVDYELKERKRMNEQDALNEVARGLLE